MMNLTRKNHSYITSYDLRIEHDPTPVAPFL
ncbi:hypothetical protein HDF10_004198 [Edaphobacter lichenicola]|uniref:Uncharacterized protein n=1 Tax=Tunturiibacter lichenicola TaxID=2051959 RepID=A0A7W8N623_9BACT|nr:hypothetical protein [Edaphobacter lichenicola]